MENYSKADKKKYSLESYKPNKNAVPVVYNGVEYASKKQCMVLNDLSRKDLDEYLKSKTVVEEPADYNEPAVPEIQGLVNDILDD